MAIFGGKVTFFFSFLGNDGREELDATIPKFQDEIKEKQGAIEKQDDF